MTSELPTYDEVIRQAREYGAKHGELKKRFLEFAEHCSALSKVGPVPGVGVELQTADPRFDVLYVGRRFRFEMRFKATKDGGAKAAVMCSEVFADSTENVWEFEINERGDTNIKPPDAQSTIGCNARLAAWYLLLNAMHRGLT